ncbi:hypothetical protein EOPP23_07275 [Endozoicomonas sp. OPT23]|uniref:hypothetical protein n=1 Tax=Endozoicomonas sp. OPT23 TaxID=2072845 RepID=UPI00129BD178|nr:hypothetical protein [Endozoicomonas sp. OPT23]MRI32783.1 hypothetical protein [Endozoicomonas sp. OPT23]
MDTLNRSTAYHKSRLGRILVQQGYISQEQLDEALEEQGAASASDAKLGEVLLAQKQLSAWQLRRAMNVQKRARFAASIICTVLGTILDSISSGSKVLKVRDAQSVARLMSQLIQVLPEGYSLLSLSYDLDHSRADIELDNSVTLAIPSSAGELSIANVRLNGRVPKDYDLLTIDHFDLKEVTVTLDTTVEMKKGATTPSSDAPNQ